VNAGPHYLRDMKRITNAKLEAVRQAVRQHNPAYEAETGVGPCGALAVVLARAGWGELAVCESNSAALAADKYAWYPHYVILRNGKVVDVSGEYLASDKPQPVYREVEQITEADILSSGPGTIYGSSDVQFWANALAGTI
jgi:hypothetical protein